MAELAKVKSEVSTVNTAVDQVERKPEQENLSTDDFACWREAKKQLRESERGLTQWKALQVACTSEHESFGIGSS